MVGEGSTNSVSGSITHLQIRIEVHQLSRSFEAWKAFFSVTVNWTSFLTSLYKGAKTLAMFGRNRPGGSKIGLVRLTDTCVRKFVNACISVWGYAPPGKFFEIGCFEKASEAFLGPKNIT